MTLPLHLERAGLVTKFTIQAHSSSVLMLATTASCSAYTASTPRRSNHEAIHSINIGPVITASAARVTGAGSVITRQLVRGARAVLTAFLTTSSQPDHTAARAELRVPGWSGRRLHLVYIGNVAHLTSVLAAFTQVW